MGPSKDLENYKTLKVKNIYKPKSCFLPHIAFPIQRKVVKCNKCKKRTCKFMKEMPKKQRGPLASFKTRRYSSNLLSLYIDSL